MVEISKYTFPELLRTTQTGIKVKEQTNDGKTIQYTMYADGIPVFDIKPGYSADSDKPLWTQVYSYKDKADFTDPECILYGHAKSIADYCELLKGFWQENTLFVTPGHILDYNGLTKVYGSTHIESIIAILGMFKNFKKNIEQELLNQGCDVSLLALQCCASTETPGSFINGKPSTCKEISNKPGTYAHYRMIITRKLNPKTPIACNWINHDNDVIPMARFPHECVSTCKKTLYDRKYRDIREILLQTIHDAYLQQLFSK